MSLASPPRFTPRPWSGNHLVLDGPDGHLAHVFVLEEDIIRVMVLPGGHLRAPRSWTIAPGRDDVPAAGRDRFDLDGFALPPFAQEATADRLTVETAKLRLSVRLDGFFCTWAVMRDGTRCEAAADRATQAYNFGWWDERVYHYLRRAPDETYFGLGERAGDLDRSGGRFRMSNIDAMGYSARTSDPLYKHIPFSITRRARDNIAFGLFYDTLADCTFDMGRELDNYHGHYRYFVAEHGDLDYYVIAGPTPAEVVRRFTWLTGRPILTPRWSLGYSGSTMSYTDAPDAQARMDEFLDRCAEHDILCDSFHLSSGYTSIGPKRYVFTWNRDKFPDPAAFAARYLAHGIRLCANIKPCLLRDHPRFAEAAAAGLFLKEPDGSPHLTQFWDEVGAYLDFTNPVTAEWWRRNVTAALLDQGIVSTWNDNNEWEIISPRASAHGDGKPFPAIAMKPLQTALMLKASCEAQRTHAPERRPFLISRAGFAGMQRYVQTWSGDNYTSWETLRYNIKMGLGLALSGVSNLGHDIGGFSGPAPEPELFLRWVQSGILMPRFSIHSWNDDGTVNEPWMHPEIVPQIRDLIRFRYRLIPYLYHLLWRSHRHYEPMIRPTFHDFPDDPGCYAETDDMMVGPNLLVAAVVDKGAGTRAIDLPRGANWTDWRTGLTHEGGSWIELAAPLDGPPPLLAREGSAIPLNLAEQHFARPADERGFAVFPMRGPNAFEAECFEDDGESVIGPDEAFGLWRVSVEGTDELRIAIHRDGNRPPEGALTLLLPAPERRPVRVSGGRVVEDAGRNGWRRIRVDPP